MPLVIWAALWTQFSHIHPTEIQGSSAVNQWLPSTANQIAYYDNAVVEAINWLYKTEMVRHRGSWRTMNEVVYPTLVWLDWFNQRRLLEPIGNIPSAELKSITISN
jgi:hypothetical protein